MHVGPKRDLLGYTADFILSLTSFSLFSGDLASAIRNRTNLVFGLYYSLFEWFNPLYLRDKSTNFTSQDYAKVLSSLTVYILNENVNSSDKSNT